MWCGRGCQHTRTIQISMVMEAAFHWASKKWIDRCARVGSLALPSLHLFLIIAKPTDYQHFLALRFLEVRAHGGHLPSSVNTSHLPFLHHSLERNNFEGVLNRKFEAEVIHVIQFLCKLIHNLNIMQVAESRHQLSIQSTTYVFNLWQEVATSEKCLLWQLLYCTWRWCQCDALKVCGPTWSPFALFEMSGNIILVLFLNT